MIKNNVFMKHFKRTLSVVLAAVVMVTLAGCAESSDKVPTNGINSDAIYAKSGNYSLTVGDLYEELRHNSAGYLNQKIEEATFDDYLKLVNTEDEDQNTLVAEYILKDIHGTFDEDELEDLSAYTKEYNIYTYIDKMMLEGYIVTYSQLTNYNVEDIQNSEAFTVLWDEYSIDVAKYLYAFDMLSDEINDHNEEAADDEELENYFTDTQIATYFDDNYTYEGSVDALIIRFINQTESDAVLKKFGIKAYNGKWYLIQPPKDEYGVTDYSKWSNESTYNKYYDEYTITHSSSTSSDAPIEELGTDATVLKMFVEIYNYIYTYRNSLTYSGRTSSILHPETNSSISNSHYLYYYTLMLNILNTDRITTPQTLDQITTTLKNTDSTNIVFSKEKLDTYSTSLTSYIHSTLSTEGEYDEDTETYADYTQYTASARSYNNNYYLIFKLSDAEKETFYEIVEDEDGNDVYEFDLDLKISDILTDSTSTDSVYDYILTELFDAELTDSYISTKATERAEFITVEIFDSMIELTYSLSNLDYAGTKGFEDNLVARITFKDKDLSLEWEVELTVLENYTFLEKIYGAQTSTYLLFDQYIVDTQYYDDIVDEEDYYDTYKENVYLTLNYFTNDYYTEYGYPASIGKYNFMKSFYRTAVVDEAIEYLTVQEAKRQFFLDLDDDFYTNMGSYSEQAYNNFYSLSLNTITVYVDMDEDGTPDTNWFDNDDKYATHSYSISTGRYTDTDGNEYTLTKEQKTQLANDLIDDIITYAKKSTEDLVTTFDSVVAEYNSSTRIIPDGSDYELSGTIEAKWAKYRKHGLFISTTALGSYDNTTPGLNADMQTLVQALYNTEEYQIIFNNNFSGSYLVELDSNLDSHILNEDGYNLLLVTSGNGKTEIDFENEDSDIYKNVPIRIGDSYKIYDDLSSTGVMATADQIEVYCREYFSNGSSTSLSSSATAYLDAYLNPALIKYNSEVVQLMIMRNTLDVEITSEASFENYAEQVNSYVEYLQRVSDGYVNTTPSAYTQYSFEGFWDYIDTIGGAN